MSLPETSAAPAHDAERHGVSAGLTFLLATACGLLVANLYYAQPLVGPIHRALGLSAEAAGLIVTLTQAGYGLGLLLIVPLGDRLENRRLVVSLVLLCALASLAAAFAQGPDTYLAAAMTIGICAVGAQVLVPYAAHLAPEQRRGQVVGNVVSGIMLGIMFARPLASFLTDAFGWRAVFFLATALMVLLALVLRLRMPPRHAHEQTLSYGALLASLPGLMRDTPILRRRALYHAGLFGAFSLFWTAVPLQLADVFGLSQNGIALFALIGVAGAVSAPIAGRVADRGWSHGATALAIVGVLLALALSYLGHVAGSLRLVALAASGVLLDFSVTANLVLGQRAIYSLGAAERGRLNGLFMATFFAGGAIGSALGGWAYAQGGWPLTLGAGAGLAGLSLLYFLTERRPR
ncbi:MFS transporter [Oleiagrimonas soli]|uniref:MFS transporter n=1 Tax=Oleiagrimonas soli TaxID=1543381 RepID=A0A099CXW3_9GAMM|nr:MFS transporter [Oleiagrimonas soli]KGI78833.1 MFS transporter [Oleiagrimonas soli]MBB6184379.1 putative MFS family arabinose efflux permease [Oleiagrimonas soli]